MTCWSGGLRAPAGAGDAPGDATTSPAGVAESIDLERELLQPVRETADLIVDTSDLNVHQLRERLLDLFSNTRDTMQIQVVSFGFKHGVPLDVDNLFDCRFLPN